MRGVRPIQLILACGLLGVLYTSQDLPTPQPSQDVDPEQHQPGMSIDVPGPKVSIPPKQSLMPPPIIRIDPDPVLVFTWLFHKIEGWVR